MSGDASNEALRSVVGQVMQDGRPSAGNDLLGMAIDFRVYLSRLDELDESSVDVCTTAEPERLLEVTCRAAPGTALVAAVEAVRGTWTQHLGYGYREAYDLRVDGDAAVLEFVTQAGPSGIYVTGTIEVVASSEEIPVGMPPDDGPR
jgi:hypothetical protein